MDEIPATFTAYSSPQHVQIKPAGGSHQSLPKGDHVTVAVLADDHLTGQGATAYLQAVPELQVLPASRRREADVLLVLVRQITEETLSWMRAEGAAGVGLSPRFVLVGDGLQERQILRAVTYGLVSVLPRDEADFERIAAAVRLAREDHSAMTPLTTGWLVKQVRGLHDDVLVPNGYTVAGLESREVDVLRLLAEGLDTMEIAHKLNYSDRTVKKIIRGLLDRFDLRNRAHAVAFAIRKGMI